MSITYQIKDILKDYYDIPAIQIQEQTGGWSALAFSIHDHHNNYFLKVFNKRKTSIKPWIEAIDRYTPLVKWLYEHTELQNHIVCPIYTKFGQYKCEDEEYVYLLSDYVDGTTIRENTLTPNQVEELARIMGVLHRSTAILPSELRALQIHETFDIDYCYSLLSFMQNDLDQIHDKLFEIIKPYTQNLFETIERMEYLSNALKGKQHDLVLSHADAHNWNLMQAQRLMLIDWECLKFAPQEQDLILNITEPYAKPFVSEYKKYIKYDSPDFEAFEYYWLKRKLVDIWEWVIDLRIEGLVKSEETTLSLLKWSLNECTRIDNFRTTLKSVFS